MSTNVWLKDAVERAVKTFVQTGAIAGTALATDATTILETVPDKYALYGALAASLLSVVTSWLSKFVGDSTSAAVNV